MNFIKKLFGLGANTEAKTEPQKSQVKFLDDNEDKISHTMPIKKELPKEHYIIKHNGEYMVFNSREEMPEDIREGIDEIENIENISSVYNVIVDGQKKQYKNYSEIPKEIQKILENKRKDIPQL